MDAGTRVSLGDIHNFTEYINKIGREIETKNIDKNKHLKALLVESRKELVDMMDESYQDAFNLEVQKDKKGT